MKPDVQLWFGLGAAVVGGVLLLVSLMNLRKGAASRNWPTVEGEVVSATVREREHKAEKQQTYATYSPEIRYRYTVSGREFTSQRLTADESGKRFEEDARTTVANYPPGQRVKVYYDPQNPAEAVLEPGKAGQSYVTLAFGLVLLAAGLVMAVFRKPAL